MEGWLEVFRQVLGKLEIMSLNGGIKLQNHLYFRLRMVISLCYKIKTMLSDTLRVMVQCLVIQKE